jgi:hypothetical protein
MLTEATLTSLELVDRRANVRSVIGSFDMEGLKPDSETAAILEQYAAGRMSLAEMGAAIETHVKQMSVKETVSGAA